MTGIICINKPKDITSFGVVAKIRGITREKKVGHTGTLDPMATGVLPITIGGATKFLNFLPDSDKGYRATFKLGITTNTLDITGEILSQREVNAGVEDVKKAMDAFVGEIMQIPPMFSAKSVDGVRLYDLARQGVEIKREPCKVEIKELTLSDYNESTNEYTIDVLCSKGTYIRSLIDDIGKSLGCGATMTALCRTRAMGFTLDDCTTIDALQKMKDSGTGFDSVLVDIERLYLNYHKIFVTAAQTKRFANGGALDIARIKNPPKSGELCTVYSPDKIFLGLGQRNKDEISVARLLNRQ